jgi:catalase
MCSAARAMGDAAKEVKLRDIGNCMKAELAYGEDVAMALGSAIGELAGKA